MSKSELKTLTAVNALENKKAIDVVIIDIKKISTIADYFIIASGNNKNQIQAMSEEVEKKLFKEGWRPDHIEGYQSANWILMDYGDLIVHIFDKENRPFYDLERIWRDGTLVEKNELN